MQNLARGTILQHRAHRTPTGKQSPLKMSQPKKNGANKYKGEVADVTKWGKHGGNSKPEKHDKEGSTRC